TANPRAHLALGRRAIHPERNHRMTCPRLFRVTVEVAELDRASDLYSHLLGIEGQPRPGARVYFDCDGVILALVDVSQGGLTPTRAATSLFLAVDDVEAVHRRASRLGVLAPYQVHGQPAAEVLERPWGERSFYVVDPWSNDLCFCEDGTLYT